MSFSGLFIGSSALRTAGVALDTVGHNISNAATEGYSRQRVSTQANNATERSYGAVGTGVSIGGIEQITSEYLESQVRNALNKEQNLSTLVSGYNNLEVIFNELSEGDISSAMDSFWASVEDMSKYVEDSSTRTAFLESAASLSGILNSMADKLLEYRETLNNTVPTTVSDINLLTTQIADLNAQIMKDEAAGKSGVSANDLRDQREVLIKELCGTTDARVITQDNGSVTITQAGRMLVYQDKSFDLATERVLDGDTLTYRVIFASDSDEAIISGGSLHATINLRDNIITSYRDELDQLAGSLIWNVNRVCSQGTGLQGYSEITGTTSVRNPASTLDNLAYVFNPVDGTYEIENGYFEMLVHDVAGGTSATVRVDVDLDGVGQDTILYDEMNPTAPHALVTKIQDALDSAAQGAFTVTIDGDNRIGIKANVTSYTLGFSTDTSGAVAALGLNTVFTGSNAGDIGVNAMMLENPQFIGCGKEFVAGDNSTSLKLVTLRDTGVLNNGNASFEDFYQGIVGRLGIESAQTQTEFKTQGDLLTNYKNQREELSGVSTDEELTKLIQWQRSYQAASKFISIMDELYGTLINM